MAFLPDTNVWIFLLKNPSGKLHSRFQSYQVGEIFLCSIVKAELLHGAHKYGNLQRRLRALEMLFAPFASLPFDDAAARHYGEIRHELEKQGRVIGSNDLKIAAIARSRALTVISSDPEFSRVSGLKVDDWNQPIALP
jgi:Predicted nucleic acid-binding protein, contains PIN domain